MNKLLGFLIFISTYAYGQEVSGYLYDPNGRVPGFPLFNSTQSLYSSSNAEGYFTIQAKPGDSIVLKSIAYQPYTFKVKPDQLTNDIVIELEPESLDEVMLYSYQTDGETLSKSLNASIQKDIDNNPTLYEPSKGNIGYLISGLMGLFKKDKNTKRTSTEDRYLDAQDWRLLFNNDKLLNAAFLVNELKLPARYHALFMDYLESKALSYSFLREEKRLELIELLFKYASTYKSSLKDSDTQF
jgi:hypothetical protein